MSGYVRIHRCLFEEHPAFRTDAEAMAFAWLIVRAQWRPASVRYKGHRINLERGQVAVSVRDFAAAIDRDKAWIERLFKRLTSEAMIETHHETGVTVVTICNYNQYQADIANGETVSETPRETDVRQTRDTEQRREEGKKVTVAKATSLKRAIPDDWKPKEFGVGTESRKVVDSWPPGELHAQHEQFMAHHRAKGSRFNDPQDAWSTWVLNTRKFGIGKYERPNNPTTIALQRVTGAFGAQH